jgi:hypothetical protein
MFTKQIVNNLDFSRLDVRTREDYVYRTRKTQGELAMNYRVTWCLVGPDDQPIDSDRFPETFINHEDAVGYILERIDRTPSFGYDRAREFWWLRGNTRVSTETRFWITKAESASIHHLRKFASG